MDGQKNWMVRWIGKKDGWLDEWIEQNRWMVREKTWMVRKMDGWMDRKKG